MPQQHYSVSSYVARRSIGYLCKRAHLLLVERLEPALAASDLTFTQYVVLIQLRDGGPLTATELGTMLCHDSGALTRVLDQLEGRELIQRERSREDRRTVQLRLTERGRSVIEAVLPRVVDRLNAALAGVSRADFGALIRLLTGLVAQLESAAPAPKGARRTAATAAGAKKARELPGETA